MDKKDILLAYFTMVKIIHIVRGNFSPYSLNGVYKVVDSISCELGIMMGVGNVCVCSVSPSHCEDIYVPEKYQHVQFSEHPLKFFLNKDFRHFLLTQPKDTIFHFHSVFIPWFLPAVRLLKTNGCQRVVLTPHGQYVDEAMRRSLKKRIFFHFFDRQVIKLVDAVQVIGHTEINHYITSNACEYHVIPNGGPSCHTITSLLERQLVFGYLGRMEIAQKGLDVLVRAFAFYRKQGGKGILQIGGAGNDQEILEKLTQEMGVSSSVCFIGKVFGKDKLQFLQKCAWFVHPSRWDVLPTACLEAASCGVPLIVSHETNLDIYLKKYDAGIVMASDDRPIQALATCLVDAEKIFENQLRYAEFCEQTQKMLQEELNWKCIASMDVKLLYKL